MSDVQHKTDRSDKRIQFDVSESLLKEINDLMANCELATKKELLNNAMSAFEWMVEQVMSGRLIVSADRENDDFEVFWMPSLRAAVRVANDRRLEGKAKPR